MLTIQNNNGVILAYLNNVTGGSIKEVLNGEFTLQFIATIDPLKTDFLYDNNNLIEYNNDLFRVVEIQEMHSTDDELTVSVQAEHISYDLLKNTMPNFVYKNQNANFVMAKCLEGTDFRFLGGDIVESATINYEKECNSKQISMAIANDWRGELKYFRRDIELLKQRGSNRGVAFRFKKDLNSIKRKSNFVKNTIAYEVNVVKGIELDELGYYELGDTIRVVDEALNIETDIRIVEVEKDVDTGLNARVILGNLFDKINVSLAGLGNQIKETQSKVEDVTLTVDSSRDDWDKIKDVTDNLGNVIGGKITGTINTGNTAIASTSGHISWTGNTIKIHDQPTEASSSWCMELGSAGWRIANGKETNGNWRWRTMATGTGIVADEITSGTLSAIQINGVNITGTEITGGTIKGAAINGGTLNIGNNNFMVDKDGNLTCNGSVILAGNILMNGNISWSADNSPIKAQYSSNGSNWHDNFNASDKFARYSYDGGKTWTASVKIVGTDGAKGDKGDPGLPGSDANVPSYITSTKITATTIESPTISGNVVYADTAVVTGLVVGKNVSMGTDAKISWANVSGKPNTTYIDASGLYTGSISADKITSGTITGRAISGGTITGASITANHSFNIPNCFTVATNGNASFQQALSSATSVYSPKLTTSSYSGSGVTIGTTDINFHASTTKLSTQSLTLHNCFTADSSGLVMGAGKPIKAQSANCYFGSSSHTTYFGPATFSGKVSANGGLATTGTKNAIVTTSNYGKRLLYCEESDRLYFNTKGIAETHLVSDNKYKHIIKIEDVFYETIEPNSICPYIINITPYGRTMIWVKDVYDKYIIIESDVPIKFAYNIQCTRKGYKDTYLEELI